MARLQVEVADSSTADYPPGPRPTVTRIGSLETRIDPPHVPARPEHVESPTAEPELAAELASAELPADEAPAILLEQMSAQARELADHLQDRQRIIDQREADLNARLAQMDQEVRKARLWFNDREHELSDRAAQLEQRESEAAEARSRLAAAEQFQDNARTESQREIVAREEELRCRGEQLTAVASRLAQEKAVCREAASQLEGRESAAEAAVLRERQAIDTRRAASLALARQLMAGLERRRAALADEASRMEAEGREAAAQAAVDERQRKAESTELSAERVRLTGQQARLAEDQAEVTRERRELAELRAKLRETAETERARLEQRDRDGAAEIDARRRTLELRSDELDACQVQADDRMEQARALEREALELRLQTQELHSQLTGLAPTAALTRSMSRIRAQLADRYRLANEELAHRRDELESLSERLAEHYATLAAEKQEVQEWVERRQEEVESQAERLVSREQDLDQQQRDIEQLNERWRDERLQLQRQIRELREELLARASVAA